VVVGVEFGKEDYNSIPRNYDRERAGNHSNQIKLVVKSQKKNT
jgi:hypothetical protein